MVFLCAQPQVLQVIPWISNIEFQIDGLMQKRRNSIALAMELRLYCMKPGNPLEK